MSAPLPSAPPEKTWDRYATDLTPEQRAQACRIAHYWAMRHARFYRTSNLVGARDKWLLQMRLATEARNNLARWKAASS